MTNSRSPRLRDEGILPGLMPANTQHGTTVTKTLPPLNRHHIHQTLSRLCYPVFNELPGEPDILLRQPFFHTYLGRLPTEVREMIYQYVLVKPTPIKVSGRRSDSPSASVTDAFKVTAQSTDPSSAVPNPDLKDSTKQGIAFYHNQQSSLAILHVCERINEEAKHIYFRHNSFQSSDPTALRDFLKGIGATHRRNLKVIYVSGLLHDVPLVAGSSRNMLDRATKKYGWSPETRDRVAKLTHKQLHPDAMAAGEYLHSCTQHKSIRLEVSQSESYLYICFLYNIYGWDKVLIDFLNGYHWVVMSKRESKPTPPAIPILSQDRMARDLPHVVQVDIQLDTHIGYDSLTPQEPLGDSPWLPLMQSQLLVRRNLSCKGSS